MAKNLAICIGINNYQYIKLLNCAVNDADRMAQWCKDSQKFDNTYLFTDNSPPIEDICPQHSPLNRHIQPSDDESENALTQN